MKTFNTLHNEQETRYKKLRNRVYSLIGFYRSRGYLNQGQMYALEKAADAVLHYDYGAYRAAQEVIMQINYETR